MAKGFVYILRAKDNRFYIGSTIDIKKRLKQHQMGRVKATRLLRPLELELFQEYDAIRSARIVERKLKRLKRRDYIEKAVNDRLIRMKQ